MIKRVWRPFPPVSEQRGCEDGELARYRGDGDFGWLPGGGEAVEDVLQNRVVAGRDESGDVECLPVGSYPAMMRPANLGGRSPLGERGDVDVDVIRTMLEQRMSELQRAREGAAEERKPVMLDQTSVGRLSRMDAMQVQAMAQATERRRAQEMDRIRATLARTGEGEFGYCIRCGEEIAPKRLELDPTAATCIERALGRG